MFKIFIICIVFFPSSLSSTQFSYEMEIMRFIQFNFFLPRNVRERYLIFLNLQSPSSHPQSEYQAQSDGDVFYKNVNLKVIFIHFCSSLFFNPFDKIFVTTNKQAVI